MRAPEFLKSAKWVRVCLGVPLPMPVAVCVFVSVFGIPCLFVLRIAILVCVFLQQQTVKAIPGRAQPSMESQQPSLSSSSSQSPEHVFSPRPASHQPRHVHDTLALQSVCVCLPLHITVFASVTTSSPNQTARPSANMCCVLLHLLILPRNALKRVLLAQSGQQRSIEVTWRACYGPATPQSLPLGQIPPPSRFPWLLLSCHATFAPLALNHWLIAEPLVHQINSKHQARMSSITFIGLAAKTGTRPLFPTSHHVTKLIWRSGHKQLVSKTKQLQSPAGCEEVRNFGWGSSEERPDSRGVTLVSREYLFLDL